MIGCVSKFRLADVRGEVNRIINDTGDRALNLRVSHQKSLRLSQQKSLN